MKQSIKKNQAINKFLLKLIVCPISKQPLQLDIKKNELISKTSKLAYPIIDGIPVLIKERARKL